TLAVACGDGAVRLWDLAEERELPPLVGHRGCVRAVRFLPDGKGLLTFGRDNKLLTWPVESPFRDWRPRPGKLGEKTLQGLWERPLGDGPAQSGALALRAGAPAQPLPSLRERLKPVAEVPPQKLKDLMANLHSSDFNVRKRAARELRGLGELALPA